MKRYRLIKEYPGSPKVGEIIEFEDYQSLLIDKYLEFYEPVIDDYLILSFSFQSENDLFSPEQSFRVLNDEGYYAIPSFGNPMALEHILNDMERCDWYKIHSVKRLSDNEVFTVGDIIQHKLTDCRGKITSINLEKQTEGISKIYFSTTFCTTKFGTLLKNAIKIQDALFTTEDNVDIYDGDTYYFTNKNGKGNICNGYGSSLSCTKSDQKIYKYFSTKEAAQEYQATLQKPLFISDDGVAIYKGDSYCIVKTTNEFDDLVWQVLDGWIASENINLNSADSMRFSTKEAAEEYVLMNKSCLSVNDLINYHKSTSTTVFIPNDELIKLAKSKLN